MTNGRDTATGGDPPVFMKPTWGAREDSHRIKSTWLGHAAFVLELPNKQPSPSPSPTRGLTFLCDPVFSQRCSPTQRAGPAPRVTRELSHAIWTVMRYVH